jgi:hypothetical protein
VHVQVRHALADRVVERHEAALRAQRGRHHRADPPDPGEQRPGLLLRQLREGFDVLAGQHQHMPLEQRPGVQERHRFLVRQHQLRRDFPGGDGAEHAIGHGTER